MRDAARTSAPAGRACRSTPSGRRTARAWIRAFGHSRHPPPPPRTASRSPPTDAVTAAAIAPSTSGASASTARDAVGHAVVQHRADAQHRAADVGQDHHAGSGVGLANRVGDPSAVGAERSVGASAGGHDANVATGDLGRHGGESLGDRRRVRDQYNARRSCTIHARHSTMSNTVRQPRSTR